MSLELVFAQMTANAMEIEDVLRENALELLCTQENVMAMSFTMMKRKITEALEDAALIAIVMETELVLTICALVSLDLIALIPATLKLISLMRLKI